MTVWETVLTFVVPSVGLCLLIALLVVAPRWAKRPRYRVGQPWPFEPLLWAADPHAAEPAAAREQEAGAGERGGARGSW